MSLIDKYLPPLKRLMCISLPLLLTACLHQDGSVANPEEQASASQADPLVTFRILPGGSDTSLEPIGTDEQGNEIYQLGENIPALVIEASIVDDSPTREQQFTFDYQLIPDDATPGNEANPDYQNQNPRSPINNAGDMFRVTFAGATRFSPAVNKSNAIVRIFDDIVDESDSETFYIVFGNERGVRLAARGYIINILDNDALPQVSIAIRKEGTTQAAASFNESISAVDLELSLSPSTSENSITVPIALYGTALAGVDFVDPEQFVIDPGQQSLSTQLLINDNAASDGNKSLLISLLDPDNAELGDAASIEITLLDDEGSGGLNATGISQCVEAENSEVVPCGPLAEDFPNQDANQRAGATFQFTEIEADNCVLDNNTGLIWEIKAPDNLRRGDSVYTWYVPYDNSNGGLAGTVGSQNGCFELESCDTDAYIRRINQIKLCGYDDWRLPRVSELLSLVDYGFQRSLDEQPQIDVSQFPNALMDDYWTATPVPGFSDRVWAVNFRTGQLRKMSKLAEAGASNSALIRLVRSGGGNP